MLDLWENTPIRSVYGIYLHLDAFYGKCRYMCHVHGWYRGLYEIYVPRPGAAGQIFLFGPFGLRTIKKKAIVSLVDMAGFWFFFWAEESE